MKTHVFGYGFRVFFLSAALWAVLSMVLWGFWISGTTAGVLPLGGVAWHAHELIFGYGAAVVAGFLLTAVANWTGRPPVQGPVLALLWVCWLLGRLVFFVADRVDYWLVAAADSVFLLGLIAVMTRELIAGRNLRNLRVVLILVLLAASNLAFHIEYELRGYPAYALRAALACFMVLISLLGGRVIPAFTRNWLLKQGRQGSQAPSLPTVFNRLDAATLALSCLALLLWTALPYARGTALALVLSGLLQWLRLSRWSGLQTVREPLLLILHVGYAYVGLGFVLIGVAALFPALVAPSVAVHAWSTGAMGVMTLAMMTRTSRGHSGLPLVAPLHTRVIYLLIVAASLLRLAPLLLPQSATLMQMVAAVAWIAAFGLFVRCYGPVLLKP